MKPPINMNTCGDTKEKLVTDEDDDKAGVSIDGIEESVSLFAHLEAVYGASRTASEESRLAISRSRIAEFKS